MNFLNSIDIDGTTYDIRDSVLENKVRNDARAVLAETDADLDVVDSNGNVLLRLSNGHIQTKNFDSSEIVIKRWAGKKWVAVGDSLTEVNSRTTMHYHDYIAQNTGISVVNLGMSGTGYMKDYSATAKAFYKRMDTVPTDADVVTIFGGGNDTGKGYTLGDITDSGTTTICGCINATIDALYQQITTVQLGIITPTPWVGQTPEDANNELASVSEAIVEICKRRSIPCLDLYHCSNLRPNDATFRAAAYSKDSGFDGVHPDETGHAIIAPRFEAFLDGLLMH